MSLPSALDEPPQLLRAPLLETHAAATTPPRRTTTDDAAPPVSYQFPIPASYEEAAFAADLAIASSRVRNRFVAKVFALLLAQLLLIAAVALATPRRLASSPGMLLGSGLAALAVTLVLSCSESARRAHPFNLVLLGVFSWAQGLLVASATAGLGRRVVLDAVLVTALAVAALTAFALWRAAGGDGEDERGEGGGRAAASEDFAATEGMLLTALVCLLAVTSVRAFFPALFPRPVDLLVSGCGALMFCAYVSWDVERLVSGGGGQQLALGADDYVLAVLTIEVDVVNLFLYVLDLLRAVEGDGEGGDDR